MKHFIWALVLMICGVALLASCTAEPAPAQAGNGPEVTFTENGCVRANKTTIGNHKYLIVYATCDGRPGHTVQECGQNHCFLRHDPDCPCLKEAAAAEPDVLKEEEPKGPYGW